MMGPGPAGSTGMRIWTANTPNSKNHRQRHYRANGPRNQIPDAGHCFRQSCHDPLRKIGSRLENSLPLFLKEIVQCRVHFFASPRLAASFFLARNSRTFTFVSVILSVRAISSTDISSTSFRINGILNFGSKACSAKRALPKSSRLSAAERYPLQLHAVRRSQVRSDDDVFSAVRRSTYSQQPAGATQENSRPA